MFRYYLQLAWRRCRDSPAMVGLVTLTTAIGIAACMTALTIFSALEGQPLPGVSDHLYVVTMDAREAVGRSGGNADTSPNSLLKLGDAQALVDAHRAPAQVALANTRALVRNLDGQRSDAVSGLLAYGPALQALVVPLRFGRPWTAAEQAARAPVAVIDSTLAEKLFGTADAVGRSVEIRQHLFRVIGVTAPWKPRTAFIGIGEFGGRQVVPSDVRLFLPVGAALDAGVGPETSGACGDSATDMTFGATDVQRCAWLEVWVALETPAAVTAYRRFLTDYAEAQHAAGRFVDPTRAKLYGTRAWIALNGVVPDDVSLNLILASAFLGLCMVNVAGLLTARFLRRQADVAIRRALGASRRQVFAQHLVESGLLGLMGGLLALPLTLFGMWIVRKQPVSYAPAAQFSPGVFVALLGLSLAVGVVVGILPAWRVCRLPPAMQIKQA